MTDICTVEQLRACVPAEIFDSFEIAPKLLGPIWTGSFEAYFTWDELRGELHTLYAKYKEDVFDKSFVFENYTSCYKQRDRIVKDREVQGNDVEFRTVNLETEAYAALLRFLPGEPRVKLEEDWWNIPELMDNPYVIVEPEESHCYVDSWGDGKLMQELRNEFHQNPLRALRYYNQIPPPSDEYLADHEGAPYVNDGRMKYMLAYELTRWKNIILHPEGASMNELLTRLSEDREKAIKLRDKYHPYVYRSGSENDFYRRQFVIFNHKGMTLSIIYGLWERHGPDFLRVFNMYILSAEPSAVRKLIMEYQRTSFEEILAMCKLLTHDTWFRERALADYASGLVHEHSYVTLRSELWIHYSNESVELVDRIFKRPTNESLPSLQIESPGFDDNEYSIRRNVHGFS